MAVVELTLENFEREIMRAKTPVLLDFWAPWCGPCRLMSPVLDELGEELEEIRVVKVNVDEQMELAAGFGVLSIPTLVVLRNGEALAAAVGLRSKQEVLELLQAALEQQDESAREEAASA